MLKVHLDRSTNCFRFVSALHRQRLSLQNKTFNWDSSILWMCLCITFYISGSQLEVREKSQRVREIQVLLNIVQYLLFNKHSGSTQNFIFMFGAS